MPCATRQAGFQVRKEEPLSNLRGNDTMCRENAAGQDDHLHWTFYARRSKGMSESCRYEDRQSYLMQGLFTHLRDYYAEEKDVICCKDLRPVWEPALLPRPVLAGQCARGELRF